MRDQSDKLKKGYIPELTAIKSANEDKDKGLQGDVATAKADLKKLTDDVAAKKITMDDNSKAWGEKKSAAETKLKEYTDGHKVKVDELRAALKKASDAVADSVKAVNTAKGDIVTKKNLMGG